MVSADAAAGATTLSVYPISGGLTNGDACSQVIPYGVTTYTLVATMENGVVKTAPGRFGLIQSNDGTTITYSGNMNGFAFSANDTYDIREVIPFTFGGQSSGSYVPGGGDIYSDINPAQWLKGTLVYPRYMVQVAAGDSWPISDAYTTSIDTGGNTASLTGQPTTTGANATSGPLLPCAIIADELGDYTQTLNILCVGDSKTKGVVGTYLAPYYAPGLFRKAAYRKYGILELGVPSEAGSCGGLAEGKRLFRTLMMAYADIFVEWWGTNDNTAGVTAAQLKTIKTNWAIAAQNAGVKRIIGCTIGPQTNATLSGFWKGNEATQTVTNSAVLLAVDNWLMSIASPFTDKFDVRTLFELPGSPGKWNTNSSIASGVCTGTQNASKLVDTSGGNPIDAALPGWDFAQANAGQLQYQGCIIQLTHSASTFYNWVDNRQSGITAGTLLCKNNWGFTPTVGDPYSIAPAWSIDGLHPTEWAYYKAALAFKNQFLS